MTPAASSATGYLCEYCDREFETERGAETHERVWCKQNPNHLGDPRTRKGEPPAEGTIFDPVETTAETAPADPSPFDETVPEKTRTPWREKIWGAGPKPSAAPRTLERPPRRRRKSTEGIWQLVWTGIGRGLIYTQADIPVGNAMTFQAPVVGPIVDKAIAGTVIDTLLQPLAGAGERFEDVGDVVALPGLVAMMERAPQLAPALEPLLRKAIRRHLAEYARMAKAQKREDEQYRKALDELGVEAGDDPVDGIIAQIWAGAAEPSEAGTNGAGHVNDVRS